jgi:hypothetical protein
MEVGTRREEVEDEEEECDKRRREGEGKSVGGMKKSREGGGEVSSVTHSPSVPQNVNDVTLNAPWGVMKGTI